MRQLREDLRAAVERTPDADERLTDWLQRIDIQVMTQQGKFTFQRSPGLVAELVVAVVDAVGAGHWHRLKACPDCHWVFYDHTRNASKRWCRRRGLSLPADRTAAPAAPKPRSATTGNDRPRAARDRLTGTAEQFVAAWRRSPRSAVICAGG